MATSTNNRRARLAAIVNGLLVFGLPMLLMVAVLSLASDQGWPTGAQGSRPTMSRMLLDRLPFAIVFAAFGAVAAWRTWVHAMRYEAGESRGWQGVGEAAAVGLLGAVLYFLPGIVTRPHEAPTQVIFYGGAAALFGASVGFVLWMSATLVLKLSGSSASGR